ncbi:hypothetical protein TDB9533_04353 [Thalassocella blandensis]|nr:hypothetical protein TDB9533_04353 [Thalassocella blandensis]
MAKLEDNTTIVFSDIVGSSRLYASLGNRRAKEKIDQAIQHMQEIVETLSGSVIKTIGDEIMASFPNPDNACTAAIALNLKLNALHFYLRTGMCFGRVIQDRNDLYGDTVNNAAYLAKAAQANQILFDEHTFQHLHVMQGKAEFFDRMLFKDQVQESRVYRLNWEQSENDMLSATMVTRSSSQKLNVSNPSRLVLQCDGQRYFMDTSSSTVIGRDRKVVQLCVPHINASRKHCTIQFHSGKFIIQDHSTNGTYLCQHGQKEVFLKRESTPLIYNGSICLGQPHTENAPRIDYFLE